MDLTQFLKSQPANSKYVFGAFVKNRREELGISLEQFEDVTRIPTFYLEEIEAGERQAPFQLLDSYKEILQIKESEIYDFEDLAFCTIEHHPDIDTFLLSSPEARKLVRTIMYSKFSMQDYSKLLETVKDLTNKDQLTIYDNEN